MFYLGEKCKKINQDKILILLLELMRTFLVLF